MAKYTLTRNQAFPDHAGNAGDVIEVQNPSDEAWKDLIDGKVLVPVKDEPADESKPAEGAKADKPAGGKPLGQAAGSSPSE